jgi:ABC-type multidrug transport system ATPase subunit
VTASTATDGAAPAIVAEHLTKRFGAVEALSDLSVAVGANELFGFIGPDGAGKTTLFRILVTLLVPDAGSARVLGLDVVSQLWALRRQLGYMPGREKTAFLESLGYDADESAA